MLPSLMRSSNIQYDLLYTFLLSSFAFITL